ncbi:MAG: DUF192 domain-containing protein, partial [Clostridia bacterium]|nr:DUF192 domain-containing protein [Clostridia bacterium]
AVLIPDLAVTTNFFERFRGLMFKQSIPDSYGLLIRPCNQIHMMNMMFPLDVIYLSGDGTVLHMDENIRPWKIGKTVKHAVGVVEVNAGTCARLGIETGDKLTIENA